MFDSDIFTFKVGPEARCFHVHNDIVASHSDALSAMMNNPHFKESSEKTALLEEVEEEIFLYFLEFAYTGTYRLQRAVHSDSSSRNLDRKHAVEHCLDPSITTKTRQKARRCEPDVGVYERIECPKCGQWHEGYGVDLCFVCRASEQRADKYVTWKDFCGLKFDTQTWTAEDLAEYLYHRRPIDPISEELICHAKLYCFGQLYLIDELKTLCLFKLHRDLVKLRLIKENILHLVNLLRYVFANTSNNNDSTIDTGSVLRKVVTIYASCKFKELMTDVRFRELLEEGGELVSTLNLFVSRRLDE